MEHADKDGIPKVVQDLELSESILYFWRSKRRQIGLSFEEQKLQHAELSNLKREKLRLEEEVAFLKKAAAYFAKMPKYRISNYYATAYQKLFKQHQLIYSMNKKGDCYNNAAMES